MDGVSGNILTRVPMASGGGQATHPGELTAGSVDSLRIGSVTIRDIAVVIGPFLAMLSNAASATLDGIIGYNFLRNYKVTIDYPNQMLSLFPA